MRSIRILALALLPAIAAPALAQDGSGSAADKRFAVTGGEDSFLMQSLRRAGGDIAWSDEAEVGETVPANRTTRQPMAAPWVTSGSSPASFTTPHSAHPGPARQSTSANSGVSPRGRTIPTRSGKAPPHSRISAALVAAVAQAPVVQPRRRGEGAWSAMPRS